MKEVEGETHDEALKHQELSARETDIKNRSPEEKVSAENAEDNLNEDYVPDRAAFHSEVSAPIGEEERVSFSLPLSCTGRNMQLQLQLGDR